MKNSTILKQVRKNIKAGIGSDYICIQINDVVSKSDNYGIYVHHGYKLRRWVSELLGPHSSYESWLRCNYNKTYLKWIRRGEPVTPRIQWVTWMIKHWKAQGN